MANPYTSVSVSNYNLNPPSDDGSEIPANQVTWSKHKSKIGDPLKTAIEQTQTAISTAFGKTISGGSAGTLSSNYSVTASDQGKLLRATSSGITITTPDATAVSSPFAFALLNNSSANITLDGHDSQTVNGDASISLVAGSGVIVLTDGSNWFTLGLAVGSTVGKHTISVPAVAMFPRATNGPAYNTTELATNDVMVTGYSFDPDTDEALQFYVPMPKSWDEGTVTARFYWTAASGAGNVVWGIRALSLSDGDAMDAAWGTPQTVTDAVITTDDMHISDETSALTIGGTPAEGDMVVFEVYRDADNGSDTHTADAILLAVRIIYTTDAENDD